MKVKTTLYAEDIKDLISEKFGVSTDEISLDVVPEWRDGIYYNPPECSFYFEEEVRRPSPSDPKTGPSAEEAKK